jgi:hypothetical protein
MGPAAMSSYDPLRFKSGLIQGAALLALAVGLCVPVGARAETHYFSLKKIFTDGKCAPVIPNFELMTAAFAGGEITNYKIHGDEGEVVEVITSFVNKARDQWALAGLKTESKVIFCLYASGIGKGSVHSQTISPN